MKPVPANESFADLGFPLLGVDVSKGFGAQQPGTTPVGSNVRGYEPASRRAKGGARPGLAAYTPQLPNGAHLIQNLNIVDPTDDAALLAIILDWPGLPAGGIEFPAIPSVPFPPAPPLTIPGDPEFGRGFFLDTTTPGRPQDWGTVTVSEGTDSRNPGRIIPVGGSGIVPVKNRKKAGKRLPTIVWANPAAAPVGTILSGTQLNAVARDPVTAAVVPGTFRYTPAAGAATTSSPQTLYAFFTPANLTAYYINTKSVVMGGAITFLQANGINIDNTTSAATIQTVDFLNPIAVGNLLVCMVAADNAAASAIGTALGDTLGNAGWTAIARVVVGDFCLALWYAIADQAGANTVFTVSATAGIPHQYITMAVAEYSGANPTTPLNDSGSATGASAAPSAGARSTSSAQNMALGAFLVNPQTVALTPDTGFTQRGTTGPTATFAAILEELNGVATPSQAVVAAANPAAAFAAITAAFKP